MLWVLFVGTLVLVVTEYAPGTRRRLALCVQHLGLQLELPDPGHPIAEVFLWRHCAGKDARSRCLQRIRALLGAPHRPTTPAAIIAFPAEGKKEVA